ncbi:MAG TPA: hypothetical protein VGL47_34830 [Amycolatopsis sp.]|uniref:hypothetical protein n=1 Tax=Amycolatopsis sp. TaxID=37632 RepID=UPI002F3E5389
MRRRWWWRGGRAPGVFADPGRLGGPADVGGRAVHGVSYASACGFFAADAGVDAGAQLPQPRVHDE